MEHTEVPRKVHQGRNVKRFREMLGIKQEALADQLCGDWSQKKISLLEGKETIEPALLDELAHWIPTNQDQLLFRKNNNQ